ncbi:uncharacterized protein BO96DRAFT_438885 [Aspergillus niger CBS 101883]|uniref:uncharacterized protein n=1 Tax=Aspergillus lacticoffeatus (strain CBS 101883) TaxID=1450533 RepID=UPI000D7F1530|nr:uncharacterized protein BO96DRAFT_438885 [Aspergillus niger CBS 101883]PYH51447.1 hypothetical protein BO96DRAFT_438885 [Aspergillus niger CBS 101883]
MKLPLISAMVVDVANEASFSPEPVEEVLRALHSSQMANVHPRAWYARLLDRQFGMQTRSSDNKEWLKKAGVLFYHRQTGFDLCLVIKKKTLHPRIERMVLELDSHL